MPRSAEPPLPLANTYDCSSVVLNPKVNQTGTFPGTYHWGQQKAMLLISYVREAIHAFLPSLWSNQSSFRICMSSMQLSILAISS